jgi:hypothetical protein
LDAAQGLLLTAAFYWDLNDQTRAWAKKFAGLNPPISAAESQKKAFISVCLLIPVLNNANRNSVR